jgi:addiction module RelE/StbE family toxin
METYKVTISPLAAEDMDGIYGYIAHKLEAPEAAQRLMLKIEKSILNLKDMAHSHAKCLDETLNKKGYRQLIVNNYLAFYTIKEEEKTVLVVRVLYGRRQIEALL